MTMSVLVKICGITNVEDAEHALEAGADWIGLNLVGGPRQISWTRMWEILESVNRAEASVLLVDLATIESGELFTLCALEDGTHLQVYHLRRESRFAAHKTIAVHHVVDSESLAELDQYTKSESGWHADYVLLDAVVDPADKQLGGTGRKANWNAIELAQKNGRFAKWPPIILAGGLNPDNVAEAVRRIRPFAVDVSSGVEKSPGIKDRAKVEDFIAAAKGA